MIYLILGFSITFPQEILNVTASLYLATGDPALEQTSHSIRFHGCGACRFSKGFPRPQRRYIHEC